MKNKLVMMLLFLVTQSFAQNESFPIRSHEIGAAFRMPDYTAGYQSQSGVDLMLKHYIKPHKAYRIMIGFQNQDFKQSRTNVTYKQDTLYIKSKIYSYSTLFAGIGMQWQRHFYKKIFLTAALDTRFHIGNGKLKSNEELNYTYIGIDKKVVKSSNIDNVKALKWDFYPSIGAKFEFARVNFGLELTAAFIQYFRLSNHNSRELPVSLLDMDLGNNFTRFYFNYRF